MKTKFAFLLVFTCFITGISYSALPDNYQGRLYKLARAWGYMKYYHSNVSNCNVNWDSALLATLPKVKSAADNAQFNDALLQMLRSAGPMQLATTAAPVLDPKLSFNIDSSWMMDTSFSAGVRGILDTVRHNFRPHAGCQAEYDSLGTSGSFLIFPGDQKYNISSRYPSENDRLLMFFRFWNIVHYFNPNSQITDHPWDSTLYLGVLPIANAPNAPTFYGAFRKAFARMDDTHTQGLSYSYSINFPGYYLPKLAVTYADSQYVVTKSGYTNILRGDIIRSIDGLTVKQVEDSMRPYISASNMASFHRDLCPIMLSGRPATNMSLVYEDSTGAKHSTTLQRNFYEFTDWYTFDTTGQSSVKYKTLNCNAGYVHMGNLQLNDVTPMYDSLQNKPFIIFDIRNYPNGTAWPLSLLMLPKKATPAIFTVPDMTYPGTFYQLADSFGIDNNASAYKGKVIILMNQETQSQAEYTCMILSLNKDVIKIGSQTAGADGNITSIHLSNDLYSGFSTLGVKYPDGTNAQRTGIVPDILAKPTIAGIRHGVDEVLNLAISLACKTGIEQANEPVASFVCYPNPVNANTITLHSSQAFRAATVVSLCDMQGRVLMHQKLPVATGQDAVIQLPENTPNGMYFITVTGNSGVSTQKIIISK